MADSGLSLKQDGTRIHIVGALDVYNFPIAKKEFNALNSAKVKPKIIDLSGVTRLDTAGANFLKNAIKHNLKLENLKPEHKALFDLVSSIDLGKPIVQKHLPLWKKTVINIGENFVNFLHSAYELISFLGQSTLVLLKALIYPSSLRLNSIIHHIKATGINAIPIISVVAFVISIVIAYQGQVQLKPLGVKQYTVDLIAISILREMGVLLTAIMIAGRSGSSFTAEIGVMRVRQEVDALRSIGFDPFELLVLPRLIALLIALPLLTILADIMGLFGGAVISTSLIDMSLPEYFERARQAITWRDFTVGMIKAPIFAFVIALVGCMHGLKISGSAESVGRETTVSVVKSIFLVLILDGLFSIYFQMVGL